MKTAITQYEQSAIDFLTKTGTTFKAERTAFRKFFEDDKEPRDIYTITLKQGDKKPMVFEFGQSIRDSGTLTSNFATSRSFGRSGRYTPIKPGDFERKRKEPTAYDVLACLQKYDVGSFEDFCDEFGYSQDSRKAERLYLAVVKDFSELERLFTEKELHILREIQ